MKKRLRFIAAMCAASILGLCAMTSTYASGEMDQISKRGEIRFGYVPSPPSTAKDPNTGALTGFYPDAARAIAEQMGLKPVFIETTWNNFVAGLQSDQFDVSIAATLGTVKRAMAVTFTKPLVYLGSVALVRKDENRFKMLEDLNKPTITIAVVQGTAAEDWVRRTLPKAKLVSLGGGNLTAGFLEVVSGRADASFEDGFTVSRFVQAQPSTKILFAEKPVFFLPVVWAVKMGNTELQQAMNIGLENLQLSGQWNSMVAKYIPPALAGGRFVDAPNLQPFPVYGK
jgi:polar amino acid transport system substrate-binding protein